MEVDEPVDQTAYQINNLLVQMHEFLFQINNIREDFGRLEDEAELVRLSGLARIDLNGPEVQHFFVPHPNDLHLVRIRSVRIEQAQNEMFGEHYILHFGLEFPAPLLMRMIIRREGFSGQPLQNQPWVIKRYTPMQGIDTFGIVPCVSRNRQPVHVPPDMVFYVVNGRQAAIIRRFVINQNGAAQIPIIRARLQEARIRLHQMLETLNILAAGDNPLWDQAMQENQQLVNQFMQSIQTVNEVQQWLDELENNINHIRNQLLTAASDSANTHFLD